MTLVHAGLDETSWASRRQVLDDVRALPNGSVHVWSERGAECSLRVGGVHSGMMDLASVELPPDATYYLCGPLPFMQAVRSSLIEHGVAPRDIQYEVFGPDLWQADLVTTTAPGAGHATGQDSE